MKCVDCGDELRGSGTWLLGNDRVCKECYAREVEPAPESVATGIAIGTAGGLIVWARVISVALVVAKWIAT